MNRFAIIKAEHIGEYKLSITFADGKKNIVDFEPFFIQNPHPMYSDYHNPERFLEFKIENGNVVWGDDWNLIINAKNLYYNNFFHWCPIKVFEKVEKK